ncbi:hypothetical protein [Acaryochloris marina]|uniref:Band 7 family protein, putative n=1 Tax=Acaryochloris marina (strain MBIC 11017) TaxID=329726 RepID=B0CFF3_ACAM1|nr:hypothetical protein [Acaryochloris marina]ABW25840.1 band 7 family protein, putative [Acaryochloris marina MBIC11017]
MEITFILVLVVPVVFIIKSVVICKYTERVVIFRGKKPHRADGPGLVLVTPVLERVVRVNINGFSDQLSKISPEELLKRLVEEIKYQ